MENINRFDDLQKLIQSGFSFKETIDGRWFYITPEGFNSSTDQQYFKSLKDCVDFVNNVLLM